MSMNPNDPRPEPDDPPPPADSDWKELPGSLPAADGDWKELPTTARGDDPLPVLPALGKFIEVTDERDEFPPRYDFDCAPPRPRPVGPGFWMSAVWCLAFVGVMVGAMIPVLVIDLIAQIPEGKDSKEFVNEQTRAMQSGRLLPEMARALARGMLVAEIVSVLFAIIIIRATIGRNWRRILAIRVPRGDHVILCLLALPGLMILHAGAHELARWLLQSGPIDAESGKIIEDMFAPWPRWLTILVIGVGPGIGEELWCRGFLGRGLLGRYGFVVGILLTSFFFGLLHLEPAYAIGTAMMGMALHFIYITTRSLLAPMLLHFLNNSLSMLFAFKDIELPHMDESSPPKLLYLGSAFLVAAVGYTLYVSRGRLQAPSGGPPTWQPPFPSVALPPPESGTEVVHDSPTPQSILCVVVGAVAFGLCWYFA